MNIWEDQEAATRVRDLTDGHETVPTVEIGQWVLVNPAPARVLETASEVAPELVTASVVRASRRVRSLLIAQWLVIGALVAASLTADLLRQSGITWALDGVAVASYLAFRFGLR